MIELMIDDEDFSSHYISFENREKLQKEVLHLLNTNYQDADLHDLQNKLEMINMFQNYQTDLAKISRYNEEELIDQIIHLEQHIRNKSYYVEEQTVIISTSNRFDLMEISFRLLRKDYQELRLVKELKKRLVQTLKNFDSPKSKLAYIFSDF